MPEHPLAESTNVYVNGDADSIGANERKIERYTAVGTWWRWRKRPSDSGCGGTVNNRHVDVRGALFTVN